MNAKVNKKELLVVSEVDVSLINNDKVLWGRSDSLKHSDLTLPSIYKKRR